jgi:putative transposase
MLAGVNDMVGGPYGFQQVLVIVDGDKITVADLEGEILIEHTRPAPGVTYVGSGGPRGPRPKTTETSPMS